MVTAPARCVRLERSKLNSAPITLVFQNFSIPFIENVIRHHRLQPVLTHLQRDLGSVVIGRVDDVEQDILDAVLEGLPLTVGIIDGTLKPVLSNIKPVNIRNAFKIILLAVDLNYILICINYKKREAFHLVATGQEEDICIEKPPLKTTS